MTPSPAEVSPPTPASGPLVGRETDRPDGRETDRRDGREPRTDTPAGVAPLGHRARVTRLVAAACGLVLITAGTLVGTDDDFPAGPLRMYATRDDPNGAVTQAAVLAVTASGRSIDVTDTSGAPRRAELEGRLGALSQDPDLFADVAHQFLPSSGRVDGSAVVQIRLVQRIFPLHDGRAGPVRERLIAAWRVSR